MKIYDITMTLALSIILIACGDEVTQNPSDATQTIAQANVPSTPKDGSDGQRGMSCTTEERDDGAVVVCEDGTIAHIKDGKDGLDGENGAKGELGQTGVQGAQGAAGPQGQQGPEGSISPVIVTDAAGLKIGDLLFADSTSFAVVMEDGLRAKVENNGYTENMRTYFSGAACSGTRRAVMLNGQFGNFALDNFANDGTFWRLTGNNLGSYNYQSREDGDGVCDNATGSITNSFAIEENQTFTFSLPFPNPPRIGGN